MPAAHKIWSSPPANELDHETTAKLLQANIIWQYYALKKGNVGSTYCLLCGRSVTRGKASSTSNMIRHLKAVHITEYEKYVKDRRAEKTRRLQDFYDKYARHGVGHAEEEEEDFIQQVNSAVDTSCQILDHTRPNQSISAISTSSSYLPVERASTSTSKGSYSVGVVVL